MVFAHRHGYARSDPGHGANGGDKAKANNAPDNPAPFLAENVFTGYQSDFDLTGHFVRRRGGQKHGVKRRINHQYDQRAAQKRARHIFL